MPEHQDLLNELSNAFDRRDAQVGWTGMRPVQLGDGSYTANIIDGASPHAGSVHWHVKVDDGTSTIRERGTAILDEKLSYLYANSPSFDGLKVTVGYPPGKSLLYVMSGDSESEGQQFGKTPLAAQAMNAAGQQAVNQISTLRLRLTDANNPDLTLTVDGPYVYAAPVTLALTKYKTTTIETLSTAINALTSGQHCLALVCLDKATGNLVYLVTTAIFADNTPGQPDARAELDDVASNAFDLLSHSTYLPCGIAYLYFGQAAFAQEDIFSDFDPRPQYPSPDAFLSIKHNWNASVAPTTGDDETLGYSVPSRWYDRVAQNEYVCFDATTGAAVWKQTT